MEQLTVVERNKALNEREKEEGKTVLVSRPINAWLALTSKCNMRCSHCPRSKEYVASRQGEDMPEEVFGKLEHELFPYMERCVLGGNNLGEQLMAASFDLYLDRLSRFDLTTEFVSNATLLTETRIEKVVSNESVFLISVEGMGETYEKIRGWKWEHIIGAIRALDAERARHAGNKTRILLGFTVFYDNIEQLPEMVRLKAIGVDRILVHHLSPHCEEQRHLSLIYHRELSNRCFDEARSIADEVGMELELPENFDIPDEQDSTDRSQGHMQEAPCYFPWESVAISERGEVMPCCASQKVMGRLTEQSFEDIWNGKQYQLLRKTVNSASPMYDCKYCVVRGGNVEQNILKAIGGEGRRSIGQRAKQGTKSILLKAGQEKLLNRIVETYRRLSS